MVKVVLERPEAAGELETDQLEEGVGRRRRNDVNWRRMGILNALVRGRVQGAAADEEAEGEGVVPGRETPSAAWNGTSSMLTWFHYRASREFTDTGRTCDLSTPDGRATIDDIE